METSTQPNTGDHSSQHKQRQHERAVRGLWGTAVEVHCTRAACVDSVLRCVCCVRDEPFPNPNRVLTQDSSTAAPCHRKPDSQVSLHDAFTSSSPPVSYTHLTLPTKRIV
eukprot:TRINITY_DN618_c0_g1_i1.p2 TRINITY_DN618_c0_g1~~TRINITY_DN618_c0_g1_i1.p2  ORF type:complete len:110 (-),score=16.68 TRINITY_DN618_c0_g1_i1:93-422(-)